MKVVNIDEVSPTKRKLILEISPDDLETEREEAYAELEKEAVLPGFRPGKVPRRMLEWRFDKEIRKEAFNDALQKAIQEVAEENKLDVVGAPDYEEEEIEAAGEKVLESAVEVTVSLEVIPEFELSEYKGKKFEVEEYAVTDEDIENYMTSHRERAAYYTAVDDRKARKGDFLVVDIKSKRGEEDFPALSGEKTMLRDLASGNSIAGFEEGFLDRSKGEKFDFEFDLPEDHPLYEKEGENHIHATAKIHQITERILPELDDEYAKDIGFPSLDEYRDHVKDRVESFRDEVLQERKRDQVIRSLLNETDVSVPTTLTQMNYLRMKMIRDMEEREHGHAPESRTPEEKSSLEAETMFEAEQIAKRRLILKKIAEEEGMEVDDDEYYKAMADRARERGEKDVDRYLAKIDREGLEGTYKESILMDKVVDWLLENNEFVTVSPE